MEKIIISYQEALKLPAGEDINVCVEDLSHTLKIKNGVARLANNSDGLIHSIYPNIHKTGSLKVMKEMYWGKDAKTVLSGDYYYKVSGLNYNENCRWDMLCFKLSTAHL